MGRDRAARPEAKPLRLFVAVEIPETVKDVVEDVFAPWRDTFPQARWVPRDNLHVTLKFLGRTWPRLSDWVPKQVGAAAADASPFTARLRGVGSFPSAKRGRALWAGFEETDPIAWLAAEVEAALTDEFPTEKRPFHPHLTVARSDPPLRLPTVYGSTELETDEWDVDHVTLFRSHLGRPAPRYEPLLRFPLGS
ncbi:MAG: RNA 2',3'-cyclic phosphodiesterase [Actinomycetota bacterium]